jgi:hypothetical protein
MTATARSFAEPAKTTHFGHGHEDVADVLGASVGLAVFEPGWRWSNDVRPMAGSDLCQVFHVGYMLEGRLHVEYADGSTLDTSEGDLVAIPPGHDAWVVGDQHVRLLDWGGKAPAYTQALASHAETGR